MQDTDLITHQLRYYSNSINSRGKGIWKFNCSLLKDKDYFELINKTIKDETVKYAAKIYNTKKINEISFDKIHLTIGDHLFLEASENETDYNTILNTTEERTE